MDKIWCVWEDSSDDFGDIRSVHKTEIGAQKALVRFAREYLGLTVADDVRRIDHSGWVYSIAEYEVED